MELSTTTEEPVPVLVVVGAGPKAAALAVKAHVLCEKLKLGKIELIVVEHASIAANWTGDRSAGFTDGKGQLGTTPEKDLGYPYRSVYGIPVDLEMLRYSWQAYLIENTRANIYSEWVDRGREHPEQGKWAKYLEWAIEKTLPGGINGILKGLVKEIVPENDKLKIGVYDELGNKSKEIVADGVVLTGPGEPILIRDMPPSAGILDGRSYWRDIGVFEKMQNERVALIGGGETAASIARSLLGKKNLRVEIINRHGTLFTRGESYREIRLFSNPDVWRELGYPERAEFIKRTDRGVFSVAAQREIDRAENIITIIGDVKKIEEHGNKIIVQIERAGELIREPYDKVIVALGFNPWSALKLFPHQFRPPAENQDEKKDLERSINEYLILKFDSIPELAGRRVNVHMPMVAGLEQGPGFPNLLCLGHMADRILSRYISVPKSK